MNLLISIFAGLLFFFLSPNIFLRLPKNGNKFTVAGVHAVVFAIILLLFQSLIFRALGLREGMTEGFREGAEGNCPDGKHWDGKACVEGFREGAEGNCPEGQHWNGKSCE